MDALLDAQKTKNYQSVFERKKWHKNVKISEYLWKDRTLLKNNKELSGQS